MQSLFFFMFAADLPSLKLWHGKDAGKHENLSPMANTNE
jgi:hypothetical protein